MWISDSGADEVLWDVTPRLRYDGVLCIHLQSNDSEDEDIKLSQNVTKYLPVKPSKRETLGRLDDERKHSDQSKYRQLFPVDRM